MSTPTAPSAPSNPSTKAPAGTAGTSQASVTSLPEAKKPTGATASAGGSPQNQTQAPERMLKVKVDGQLVELPESEVLELASAGKSSNKRFQEAAQLRKEADAILKYARENPVEFFQKTGMNARQWAEEYLMGELKKDSESPEQKKARENEERLRKYEAQEKEQAEKTKKAELDKAMNEQREKYDKLFTQALFESGLPRTKFTVKRMAELQLINIKNKFDLSAQQLAKLVREDYINEQKSLTGALDGDQLLEFLGADLVKKISKAQIAKLKSRGTGQNPNARKVETNQPNDQGESGLSWREYQRRNRRLPSR